jgi:glycosyltransferase involved in cell wall biosynthesis
MNAGTSGGVTGDLLWVNHFAVPTSEGGGTRHVELGSQLAQRHWRVQIAASDFHYVSRRYFRRESSEQRAVIQETTSGVEFQWFWSAPYQGNDWRRAWNWLSFAQSLLRWQPHGAAPDIVIGSTPHLFAALGAARLADRWRIPFVLEVRDLWPESLIAAGGRKGPAFFVLDGIARYLYRRADRIICLARGTADYLANARAVPRRKLVFIPNGVNTDAFVDHPRAARTGLTLLYAGAHGPANGLDVLLDAAERLRNVSDVRFVLIGDGPSKAELRSDAARRGLTNVEFRDPVSKTDMPQVLAEVDAGLMVLRDTPLFAFGVSPNKLFDYMGAALPVVCNVPGEVAEMMRAAGAGEQAEPGSAGSLADAILRLAKRPAEERAAMGRSARDWVRREHRAPVLAERLDAALRELLVNR